MVHLFDLILYVQVNSFSVISGWVFLGYIGIKQGLMCLAQGHNAMLLVRLEPFCPAALIGAVLSSSTHLAQRIPNNHETF